MKAEKKRRQLPCTRPDAASVFWEKLAGTYSKILPKGFLCIQV
jgi:hypothetical protein